MSENNVLGRIPNEHFRLLSAEYTTEQAQLREKLPKLEQRLERLQNSLTNVAQFIDKAKRYSNITELAPEILRLFIEKIVVGEKPQKYSRTAEQDIWIYYRDIGLMDTPEEPSCETEAVPEEYELMDIQATDLTAEAARPITGIYIRFTFCHYDTPPFVRELFYCVTNTTRSACGSGKLIALSEKYKASLLSWRTSKKSCQAEREEKTQVI
ncbi:protein of unknown function (DUF4368) [Ruminiclostridium cellobioparum subsp. termitidis CT1112]|uniref:DUF4368 domain-containing protein n=1 Tax=Ruminiclostridium cellobioparum subsp. termitidis CT1112 TaxID=1195236 RepID=S0FFP3_RUMCE|nr:protein of unknown function (DUF4368) [Ruminiclostridium cellobioparum subsp. termitidis CT1112]